ncbi:hypothetical protein FRZ00_10065 [Streptomyces mobaraensis]|uniref:Uncharacterized protein n=1 Tax=Streptomyces mobaraensis TaxID=35621 RepID=A0A5N5WA18_STRMB|nr:hypothetical protein FRZ00_10065 [Streptomyces mobaraensis]
MADTGFPAGVFPAVAFLAPAFSAATFFAGAFSAGAFFTAAFFAAVLPAAARPAEPVVGAAPAAESPPSAGRAPRSADDVASVFPPDVRPPSPRADDLVVSASFAVFTAGCSPTAESRVEVTLPAPLPCALTGVLDTRPD